MLQDERLDAIIQYLNEYNRIDIETICKINHVSKDTARRDLIKLEDLKKIIRIRGGAKKRLLSNEVYNYDQRMNMELKAKSNIGKMAASLINDEEHLILDASTTVQFVVKYLTSRNNTIVTNSINIASTLSQREDLKINILSGTLNHRHQAIYGSKTIRDVQNYHVNKCLIGTCGISSEGLSTSIEEEGLLLNEIIKRSDQVIVLADSTKFNKSFFQKVCELDAIDIVITDKDVPKMREILNKHAIEVMVIPENI
ncbi:DeoR/GlpR family DNA-binding transcription regulator [Metabacillus sediminilitoris]|uniref:DeoR/GlpR transcriptional regulator n=1 Tax=Metabacillus sediminilitoris TaxID=2567941 RepID=A0A4S4BQH5_9BACI|nr:DeoR/GlpR family DNA-binding transcription regulator [Metabacillus sediminilitoris]QGQ45681.1 DeoR family transcriptional regulator [Metabacillus sediminilitoris]THF77200.1 DeoR/GlpR transcriptional regulator [Metabacillus sediminilitoris]